MITKTMAAYPDIATAFHTENSSSKDNRAIGRRDIGIVDRIYYRHLQSVVGSTTLGF